MGVERVDRRQTFRGRASEKRTKETNERANRLECPFDTKCGGPYNRSPNKTTGQRACLPITEERIYQIIRGG